MAPAMPWRIVPASAAYHQTEPQPAALELSLYNTPLLTLPCLLPAVYIRVGVQAPP